MDGLEDPNSHLKDSSSGNAVFDASQYAFFGGNDIVGEVELGGLEDEEEDLPAVGFGDDEEEFLFDRQEGADLQSLLDVDDMSSTFSKLNKVVGGPRGSGVIDDHGSRESSSAADWVQGGDFPSWYGLQSSDADVTQEGKRWSSQPYSASGPFQDSKPLYRTASYPEPQQQQQLQHQFSSEPILVPKSSYTSYPPPGGQSPQASPNYNHPNVPYFTSGPQMTLSSNLSPFSNAQLQISSSHHGSPHYAGNLPQLTSSNNQPPGQWVNQGGLYPGERPNRLNVLSQQFHHQNGLVPPDLMLHQHRLVHPSQPPLGPLSGMQSQLFNSHLPPSPPLMSKFDPMIGLADLRDQRLKPAQRIRQNPRYSQPGFDMNNQRNDGGWSHFRSKYMTTDELECILRMQLTATHSNDPYVDDYYHQASIAKRTAGAKLKHHFCPTHLRDLPPQARANNEPHAFLQVDALGRVPFSSIRRPRPLLEVEPSKPSDDSNTKHKISEKPLEEEPMLAVRVTIEDGLCLLLDVDDIDHFLEFNQVPDGGSQLRHRRRDLLEELAAYLHLVDPLGKIGQTVGLASKDDLVFLRIVSLPKGRKLLARYLQLLFPGDLMRVVCMAVFRHLRFLFGGPPSDFGAAETTSNLAGAVSVSVRRMDLGSLSACLAAVVCSSEQPPLCPLSSVAGSGASRILISVLERASELLKELQDASSYNVTNRALWKASFDEFFNLLIKYCENKYDSVMQSSIPDPAEAIKRELPMELLRASISHTNDLQKKKLYELSQRSLVGHGDGSGSYIASNSVLS